MSEYQIIESVGVLDTENNRIIPEAKGNRHWAEYQQWLADGNEADMDPDSSIEAIAAQKYAAVQKGKNKARDGGVSVDGVTFDSDESARLAFLELGQKLAEDPAYTTDWKASSGVWVTMDAALYAKVQTGGEAHIKKCFAWQKARDEEIAAALAAGDKDTLKAVGETYFD